MVDEIYSKYKKKKEMKNRSARFKKKMRVMRDCSGNVR